MLHKSIDWLTIDWQFSTLIFVFYCITSLVLSCVLSTHNKGILYCTVFQYITASICGRIYARVYLSVYSPRRYCIVFCTACTMSLQRKFMFAISSPDEFCVCRFAALRYGNAIILLQTLINLGLLRATLLPVVLTGLMIDTRVQYCSLWHVRFLASGHWTDWQPVFWQLHR